MINEEIRKKLPDDSIIFENQAYDESILGVTLDGRVIYMYEQMIEELMNEWNISYDEATEWIHYNTLRSLPYIGDRGPIVVYMDY